jgi:hypothetical protein
MPKTATSLSETIRAEDPIVKYGDPVLRAMAKPVLQVGEDMAEFVKNMEQIMRDARGVGLAAPQLGVSQRVIVYDVGDGLQAMVNRRRDACRFRACAEWSSVRTRSWSRRLTRLASPSESAPKATPRA